MGQKLNNKINQNMEKKDKNKYKRFPIIERKENLGVKTKWKISRNLTNYLCDFFTYNEMKTIGNINIRFRNIYSKYLYEWVPYLTQEIKDKYNIELPSDEIDETFSMANEKKRIYKIRENDGLYLTIENNKLNIIKLAKYSNWAWKNDNRYWMESAINNSYLGETIPRLKMVFWCDTNFSFNLINSGNFSLYLHHAFPSLEVKSLNFKVFVDGISIFESDYPNENLGYKKGSVLEENFVCKIQESDFDNNKINHEIKLQFNHKNLWGINGWLIDGAKLVKDYDLSNFFI